MRLFSFLLQSASPIFRIIKDLFLCKYTAASFLCLPFLDETKWASHCLCCKTSHSLSINSGCSILKVLFGSSLDPIVKCVWIISFKFLHHKWLLVATLTENSPQLSTLNKSLRGVKQQNMKNFKNAWLLPFLLLLLVPAAQPHPSSWGYYETRYWPQIERIRQAVWLL